MTFWNGPICGLCVISEAISGLRAKWVLRELTILHCHAMMELLKHLSSRTVVIIRAFNRHSPARCRDFSSRSPQYWFQRSPAEMRGEG